LALVEQGAGHYETGCAPCHGAPGWAQNRIPRNMLPEPPFLPPHIADWSSEELFWLVRHGLKYTGMPSWPAEGRDDEVWAVTAFLLRLPEMSAEEYATLALGAVAAALEPAAGAPLPESAGALFELEEAALLGACARCHGIDGSGRPSGAFPRLDIQSPDYLHRALREYAEGIRPSGMMGPVAAALGEAQMARLARHYSGADAPAANPAANADGAADQALLDRGLEIAAIGIAEAEVPPCAACHGLEAGPANAEFPALGGQHRDYLRRQLLLWKAGTRGGSAYSEIMQTIVARMSLEDLEASARYYASLPAAAAADAAGKGPAPDDAP
jgi:cytochrome c553